MPSDIKARRNAHLFLPNGGLDVDGENEAAERQQAIGVERTRRA